MKPDVTPPSSVKSSYKEGFSNAYGINIQSADLR